MRLIIIGFGTVGRSFAGLLQARAEALHARHGVDLRVVGVATGTRGIIARQSSLDLAALMSAADTGDLHAYPQVDGLRNDFESAEDLIRSIDADVVVEVSPTNLETGQPAHAHMQAALETGKHVVTANKGPIALAYSELQALAAAQQRQLRFESSVMAGTPVIATGRELLAGARIQTIRGILNGTTNYMLTQMEAGMAYAQALAQAQELGYAEADPTADVEGWDAAAKLLILLAGVLERPTPLADLSVLGISQLKLDDIAAAHANNERYKLVATINEAEAYVRPERLTLSDPLASVAGTNNAITYQTDLIGAVTVQGPGAGGTETAFGLLADILSIKRIIN